MGGRLLARLGVAALAGAWIVPLVWVLLTSIRPSTEAGALLSGFWVRHPTLDNFRLAWQGAEFVGLYVNTVVVVLGILGVQLATSLPAAYAFACQRFPGRDWLFRLCLLQLMLAAPAFILPNFITIRKLGLVNTRLAVMLPYFGSAFAIFLFRQAFKAVPRDLDDAARMDGCHPRQILWHVYIPLARPAILAFSIVSVVFHWNEFLWPLIVTNTMASRTLTVGLAQFTQAGETGAQWNLIAAGTLIVTAPLLLAFAAYQRRFIESFMHSGLKG